MISLNPTEMSERENYAFLTGSIIPRPIALISTISNSGVINIAPFSYFTIVSADPPMIAVSIQRRKGERKDTANNAIDSGEFVVHITDEDNVEGANLTAAELPPDKSELDRSPFQTVDSATVRVPGLSPAKIRMECTVHKVIPLGGHTAEEAGCDLLIGNIVLYHIDESIYKDGNIDTKSLKPVARLAGHNYMKIGEQFVLERPKS
jgi:flavin reductase (DIM6/NTAB) family NADH-FMN oxidoreductase RutF